VLLISNFLDEGVPTRDTIIENSVKTAAGILNSQACKESAQEIASMLVRQNEIKQRQFEQIVERFGVERREIQV